MFIIILLLLINSLIQTSDARICIPSSCGNIHNIRSPFRLKHDPKHCGNPLYGLSCENNVTTILEMNSHKYRVKDINYHNSTIWLVDVSINNANTCSFPNNSLYSYFLRGYPYYDNEGMARPINFISCPYPLNTELATHCNYSYIKVGYMKASDVGVMCTLDSTVLTFKDEENVSLSEIHDSLLYGFQLNFQSGCTLCNGILACDTVTCSPGMFKLLWDHINHPGDSSDGPTPAVILILLLIIVVFFAGVSLPAKIIIGFICACAFMAVEINNGYFNTYWHVSHLRLIIGIFFALRFVIVLPCMIWFMIHKFRRRHLSRYDVIEDFLKSDNHLMPIRYSYSDIKKMTRGFREKLGQGGYGTVYRGKLRSGYAVAVKLLGKPGGNGQDFMNEIATIGRIHHVNVVKLVGYCAERSKRALVFDFMPNGSLDKYIFSREKCNCLSWERKYEIAVGIARGIEYLHKGCDIQILHCDIKPHNILLDHNFTPKITDFGLAKFCSTDKKMVTMTAVRGTIGYVAPELINRGFGGVSYKADVYSFGMMLIEMVGLNKDLKVNNQASSQYFPCWIYDCFEQGHEIEFGVTDEENDDDSNDTNKKIAKKMTIVALWCIQMSPGDRPSMNKVVEMLEAPVERLRVPIRPPQSAYVAVKFEDESWSTYSIDSTSLVDQDAAPSVEITVVD